MNRNMLGMRYVLVLTMEKWVSEHMNYEGLARLETNPVVMSRNMLGGLVLSKAQLRFEDSN